MSEYNIIIATDVLAEGVNLHRSNIIVNYYTPWNSTRLKQRIGRVNRIGSTVGFVYVYNFFPTAKVDSDIELQKRAFIKLLSFHAALGEDSQVYHELEDVQTFGLFNPEKEEKDSRIEFLMELRKFRDEDPVWFKKIKDMPKRARTGRSIKELAGSTLTYIRNGRCNSFFHIDSGEQLKALTFIEAAHMFKAFADEKSIPLHSKHHEHVEMAADGHKMEAETIAVSTQSADFSGSPAEKRVIKHLGALVPGSFVNHAEREELRQGIETIRLGKYAPLVRKLDKHFKDKTARNGVVLLGETLGILGEYSQPTNGEAENGTVVNLQKKPAGKPEIIFSESFDA